MLKSGRRDRKIIIQRSSMSETVIGAPEPAWSTLHELWAEVVSVGGKEQGASGREMSARLSRFVILYKPGLKESDRISYDGMIWDIIAFRELGFREGIEITAEARE